MLKDFLCKSFTYHMKIYTNDQQNSLFKWEIKYETMSSVKKIWQKYALLMWDFVEKKFNIFHVSWWNV